MADYNSAYTGAQIDANLAKAATAVQPADDAADLGSGAATDGYVLTADGAGGAAWEAAAGGGGTPGGTDTQVQFNDGGAFGGDSGFTFDKTNNTLGLGGGTITASDPIIDMAQTWNNAAVTFTAIKMNVTDTASAAGSLLMDLQVGGVSRFNVDKNGWLYGPNNEFRVNTFATNNFSVFISGSRSFSVRNSEIRLASMPISWSGTIDANAAIDLTILREAANTLAQRNGVNAQAFNLYNTYTDASNYERGFMSWASNILRIGTGKLGTGTARALEFQTDGTTRMTVEATGAITTTGSLIAGGASGITSAGYLGGWVSGRVGFSGTATLLPSTPLDTYISRSAQGILAITDAAELTEMVAPAAPAANKVRIYTEDNGSGKTRLMARFATGAAQQIAIEP